MNLQFADIDADGDQDIITATFEGHAFVVRAGEKGWGEPEHLLDHQGRKIALSLYYDMEANEYANVDRSPEGKTNPGHHCVSAMAMDWDSDGDFDLLLGAKEGQLYLQRNEGSATEPKFTGVNEMVQAGGKPLSVKGGLTAAKVVDWDRDGRDDLVCGSFEGGAYLYRDTATEGAAVFAAPVALLKADTEKTDGTRGPASDWYVDVVDYDKDGELDLVVGGHYQRAVEARVLTEDEEAELAVVRSKMASVQLEISDFLRDGTASFQDLEEEARKVAMSKLYDSEELTALYEKMTPLRERLNELAPSPKRTSGIWLYRGQPAS